MRNPPTHMPGPTAKRRRFETSPPPPPPSPPYHSSRAGMSTTSGTPHSAMRHQGADTVNWYPTDINNAASATDHREAAVPSSNIPRQGTPLYTGLDPFSLSNLSLPSSSRGYFPQSSTSVPNFSSNYASTPASGAPHGSTTPLGAGVSEPAPSHINSGRLDPNAPVRSLPTSTVPMALSSPANVSGMNFPENMLYFRRRLPPAPSAPPMQMPVNSNPTSSRLFSNIPFPPSSFSVSNSLAPLMPVRTSQPIQLPPLGHPGYPRAAPPAARMGVGMRPTSTLDSTRAASNESLCIRQMVHVRDSLALLRDGSPMMAALAQTILQRGRLGISVSEQRERILDFKGFPPGTFPKTSYLTSLSKSDLDIIAWVFDVKKTGRKEDVARRVIDALTTPLRFIVPVQTRRPHIPSRSEVRPPPATLNGNVASSPFSNSQVFTATSHGTGQITDSSIAVSRGRTNMPNLGASTTTSVRNDTLRHLSRQLESESPAVVPDLVALTTTSAPSQGTNSMGSGRGLSMSKNRKTQLECMEMLKNHSFMEGENEFNKPLKAPLGDENFVFFTSAQLTRGTEDPGLKFLTPLPISSLENPIVSGGDVQIHLRCLLVDLEKQPRDWKQAWPFPASCRVNGQAVTLNQAQRYTNGKLAGRDAATNISAFLKKHSTNAQKSMNKVTLRRQMTSASSTWGQFILFAQEILVRNHETMAGDIKESSTKYWHDRRLNLQAKGELGQNATDYDMAKLGVVHFLNDPEGLVVSSMKVSLRCPLALTRIVTPVKGQKCQHVQCFDLDTFLQYARRSSKFECPVCNKLTAQPSRLVVSPYIQHALRHFGECDEVEISKDGEMVAVERKQTGVPSDDEEASEAPKMDIDYEASPTARPGSNNRTEVVDLTLDSDDDNGNDGTVGTVNGQIPFTDADEDIDFTFNADSVHFSHSPNHIPNQNGGEQPCWTCDVIAIDSD